jgi:hypothetical protein
MNDETRAEVTARTETISVYLIELGSADGKRTYPRTVYVGQTALTPQGRFDTHRRGARSARRVRRRGL